MNRVLRRATIGAAAFFAATAFSAPAAFADTTADLGVTLGGTTIDVGVSGKPVQLTVTNHGAGTADGFTLTFDTSALDSSKVKLVLPESSPGFCDTTAKTCKVTAQMANQENFDFPVFKLEKMPAAAPGAAGKLTVKLSSTTADPNDANNSVSADVTLSESSGVDMRVGADDVWVGIDDDGNPIPIKPGETGIFGGHAWNAGSVGAKGAKVTIILPPGVSFLETDDPDCVFSDGDRKAVCTVEDIFFKAGGTFETRESFEIKVKVASTVTPMVNIPGGNLTIEALGFGVEQDATARGAAPRGGFFSEGGPEFKEIDATDNSDDFIAYIGGTLPKTGTNVLLIAAIGGGVLLVGGVLFLVTRRRRVTADPA
jgi:LPXTG-motif cell wall-anchored protein